MTMRITNPIALAAVTADRGRRRIGSTGPDRAARATGQTPEQSTGQSTGQPTGRGLRRRLSAYTLWAFNPQRELTTRYDRAA
jgi:hypothetical protein